MNHKVKNIVIFLAKDAKDLISNIDYIKENLGNIDEHLVFRGDVDRFMEFMSKNFKKEEYIDEVPNITIVFRSIKELNIKTFELLRIIKELRDGYNAKVFSIEDEWIYQISSLERDKWIAFKKFISWLEEELIIKKKVRQREAWNKGKRKGRPPAIPYKIVKRYVLKYRELALRNKKALWLIMKAEGYRISYRRFLDKVKKVLKDINVENG